LKAFAEAPGKVIISGEHFVVHGATALVAAIGRGTKVEASRGEGLTVETPINKNRAAGSGLLPVEKVVREMYRERSQEPRVRLRMSTNLPTGSGLGSSASSMVATVAAVNRLEGWNLDANSIVETSMLGERLVHGRPSGVDVAASVFGGLMKFRMGADPWQVSLEKPAKFLVIYSGKRRNSGRLISKVSSMKEIYPALFSKLCESASLVTELSTERLVAGRIEELGRIMTYNHAVLAMVGASNEHLDRLVDLCLEAGCLGAKLTGAGGGGSVLAVARRGEEDLIAARIESKGYDAFVTQVPTGGVRVWTSER
jgi:mevalonate kinase